MSAFLFHGPGAQGRALEKASEIGRPMCDPLGYEAPSGDRKSYKFLSADDARKAVSILSSTPVGDRIGTLVIGPVDRAMDKSCDVLLKALEGYDEARVVPVLWAFDLESVRPTIQSRTLHEFVPGDETEMWSDGLMEAADISFRAAIAEPQRPWEFATALEPFKGQEPGIVEAMVWIAAMDGSIKALRLWERLRELAMTRDPTWLELMAALIGGGS